MLLIYYNPQKNSFYLKFVNSLIFNKQVGDINQFNHILIQAFFIENQKFLSCLSYKDYIQKTTKEKRINTRKNKIITNLISKLSKFYDK